MKRMIAILLAVLTMTALLTGCSGRGKDNVSTTPNGTVNGSNTNGDNAASNGNTANGNTANGNEPMTGAPGPNGTTDTNGNGKDNAVTEPDRNESPYEEDTVTPVDPDRDNVVENNGSIGQDIENGVNDVIDDTEDVLDDAVNGRSRRSGTGMVGGR